MKVGSKSRIFAIGIGVALIAAIQLGKSFKILYPVDWRILVAAFVVMAGVLYIQWRMSQE